MSPVATTPPDATAVQSWRLQQLLAAGYPRREARLLSEREDIDLHLATKLLLNGCPIETALRILL
jgi:hypothetical protein